MTKISEIATTETDIANVDYIEGERGDGTSVKVPLAVVKTLTAFRGARARMTADDTAQNVTGEPAISFDEAQFDTDSFWSAGSPTRLTIPAGLGIEYVELFGQVYLSSSTADTWAGVSITHLNSSDVVQRAIGNRFVEGGQTQRILNVATGPIAVNDGDYFLLKAREESDNSVTIEGNDTNETFMSIRVVGMS